MCIKNNAYIYESDGFKIHLITAEEVTYLFGEDYLDRYGHYVPEELMSRYFKLSKELEQVTAELETIKNETYWGQRG